MMRWEESAFTKEYDGSRKHKCVAVNQLWGLDHPQVADIVWATCLNTHPGTTGCLVSKLGGNLVFSGGGTVVWNHLPARLSLTLQSVRRSSSD